MSTFEEISKEFKLTNEDFIGELETKLKYTKQTVRRNTLRKELLFWQAQVLDDKNEYISATDKFFERYPQFKI